MLVLFFYVVSTCLSSTVYFNLIELDLLIKKIYIFFIAPLADALPKNTYKQNGLTKEYNNEHYTY